MKEPPPRSWFLAFGACSLDFELRVYVPTMGDRLATQIDLLLRINDLFGADPAPNQRKVLRVQIRGRDGRTQTAEFAEIGRHIKTLRLPMLVVQEGGYPSPNLGLNLESLLKGLSA